MTIDFQTLAEVGEQNVCERTKPHLGEDADYHENYLQREYERM